MLTHDNERSVSLDHLSAARPATYDSPTGLVQSIASIRLVDVLDEREGHVTAIAANLDIALAILAEFSHETSLQSDVILGLRQAAMVLAGSEAGRKPGR